MIVLVRIASEVSLKSVAVKKRFVDRLIGNLREAVKAVSTKCKVRNEWSRLFVEVDDLNAVNQLSRVFGVASISPVEHICPSDMDSMRKTIEKYKPAVKGKKYCVRARRSGVKGFVSKDVEKILGGILWNDALKVDLKNPDIRIDVHIRLDGAYFFSEKIPGPGGFPLGVQGKALCMISGGFDSAVAAWMLMKRGLALDFVFCNLAGDAYEKDTLGVTKALIDQWCFGYEPTFHSLDFGKIVDEIKNDTEPRYNQVVLKRLMYKASAMVASDVKHCMALVTGEAMGQVSSQTLDNLAVINAATEMPVLRPLIGFEKEEIIERSRKIGTYYMSEKVKEYCALTSKKPVTKGKLPIAEEQEKKLTPGILEAAVEGRHILDLKQLDLASLMGDKVFTDQVPENAKVVDCRSKEMFRDWHYPNAEHKDLDHLLNQYTDLNDQDVWVFYCPWGLQTAVLAERMQSAGYKAFSFRGGTQAIRKYAVSIGVDW
tara:strand:+ start:836 stop:2293 length:1458 start_codon:yes stop_codon:yes gene_type:complete